MRTLTFRARKMMVELSYLTQGVFYFLFGRDHQCGCGHKAKWKTYLVVEDKKGLYILRDNKYCPQCFKEASIRCALCGKVIIPEDPVVVYIPRSKSYKAPEYAVCIDDPPRGLLGCMRHDCADPFVLRSGFWEMPGRYEPKPVEFGEPR